MTREWINVFYVGETAGEAYVECGWETITKCRFIKERGVSST